MKTFLEDFVAPVAFIFIFLVMAYFLIAPPLMLRAIKASGTFPPPPIYMPVIRAIESDYDGGTLLWYCNEVWDCGIETLGDESVPFFAITVHAIGFIGFIAGVRWWIQRKVYARRAA